jgi:hypothetical protein
MADRFAAERQTVVGSDGEARKVYTSVPGALYALFAVAELLEKNAHLDRKLGDVPPAAELRQSWLWQRADFPEFVIAQRGVRFPGDWWNVCRLERPQMPLEFWEALRESGQLCPDEARIWLSIYPLEESGAPTLGAVGRERRAAFGPYQVHE